MLANYHTHTARCQHAVGEDREYVECAIAGGIQVLGFSDHCPWVNPNGYVSGIRMTPEQLDGYVTSLTDLKREYADDIQIYIGLEAEYIP
ncbi:MAG: PHP domain-containing protein, partial [Ruminococcus sp.]